MNVMEEEKKRALEKCAEEELALRTCFRESWVPICRDEQTAFWECYERERGIIKIKSPGISLAFLSKWFGKKEEPPSDNERI